MAIFRAVASVQKQMNSTVQCLSLLNNLDGGMLYIYLEGYIWANYELAVSMWFLISVACSSCISSPLHAFSVSSFSTCTLQLGMSRCTFVFSVLNVLVTCTIVFGFCVSRLLQSQERIVGMFIPRWE
jgi:hypothetical protein